MSDDEAMNELTETNKDLELITMAGRLLGEALVITEETKREIQAKTFNEAIDGSAKWEAYRQCMKRAGASLEDQNRAAELAIRHRRQAGSILLPIDFTSNFIHSDGMMPLESTPTYEELGIDSKTATRLRDGARVPEAQFQAIVDKIAESGEKELTAKEIEKIGRRIRLGEDKAEWSANEEFPGSAIVVESDAIQFLQAFNPSAADLLLTDPPYATDVYDINAFARSWLTLALSRIAPTGRAYVFTGAYPHELDAYLSAFYRPGVEEVSHQMSLEMILPWVYRNTVGPSSKQNYKLNWQACLYFVGPRAEPLNTERMKELFSVQDFNAPDGRLQESTGKPRLHPWEKPAEIAELFIKHATMPGQVVIDPFAGTGTFLAAAARLGRNASGCEIDQDMLQFCKMRGIVDESTIARDVRV